MPPAARVGDMHMCPMVTPGVPPIPHVGGPILPPGGLLVTIGGQPAARLTDMAVCVGPPDSIAMGSPTVQTINLMNARLGDPTIHGGMIAIGFPQVMIGEAASCFPGSAAPAAPPAMTFTVLPNGTAVGTFGPNITVRGTPQFVSLTLGHLTALNNLRSGQATINALSRPVTITATGAGGNGARPTTGGWANPNLYNGTGAPATITHFPGHQTIHDGSQPWMEEPPHTAIGHELAHGADITNGTLAGNPTTGAPAPNDTTTGLPYNRALAERRAVGAGPDPTYGLPDNSTQPYSENTIRADQGLPPRPVYNWPLPTW